MELAPGSFPEAGTECDGIFDYENLDHWDTHTGAPLGSLEDAVSPFRGVSYDPPCLRRPGPGSPWHSGCLM